MTRARDFLRRFRRAEDGSMIVFALFIFMVMILAGGMATDIARYELTRSRLQSCSDRAVLAAADLDQSLDAQAVVDDYFTKCGLQQYLVSTDVEEALNYKKVTVSSSMEIRTFFLKLAGVPTLEAPALASATESVDDIEISLVLDISGSMDGSRLSQLKTAAKTFVSEVYGNAREGSVSVSVVPYSTQVSLPDWFADGLNFERQHDYSSCVNFDEADYGVTGIDPSVPLQQTMHHDGFARRYWPTEGGSPLFVCREDAPAEVLPLATDDTALTTKIDSLTALGGTSIEMGVKWGAALLDPSLRSTAADLATAGRLDLAVADHPLGYDEPQALKIMVVMTDGDNQAYPTVKARLPVMSDIYRDRYGTLWTQYDIYGDSTPEYFRCTRWSSWGHYCTDGNWRSAENFYRKGVFQLERMSYADVLDRLSFRVFVEAMYAFSYAKRDEFYAMLTDIGDGAKDLRMSRNCKAARDRGVIVYTVGFEIESDNAANVLADCANQPSRFFRVWGDELTTAFRSIARDINQLKLTL